MVDILEFYLFVCVLSWFSSFIPIVCLEVDCDGCDLFFTNTITEVSRIEEKPNIQDPIFTPGFLGKVGGQFFEQDDNSDSIDAATGVFFDGNVFFTANEGDKILYHVQDNMFVSILNEEDGVDLSEYNEVILEQICGDKVVIKYDDSFIHIDRQPFSDPLMEWADNIGFSIVGENRLYGYMQKRTLMSSSLVAPPTVLRIEGLENRNLNIEVKTSTSMTNVDETNGVLYVTVHPPITCVSIKYLVNISGRSSPLYVVGSFMIESDKNEIKVSCIGVFGLCVKELHRLPFSGIVDPVEGQSDYIKRKQATIENGDPKYLYYSSQDGVICQTSMRENNMMGSILFNSSKYGWRCFSGYDAYKLCERLGQDVIFRGNIWCRDRYVFEKDKLWELFFVCDPSFTKMDEVFVPVFNEWKCIVD